MIGLPRISTHPIMNRNHRIMIDQWGIAVIQQLNYCYTRKDQMNHQLLIQKRKPTLIYIYNLMKIDLIVNVFYKVRSSNILARKVVEKMVRFIRIQEHLTHFPSQN